MSGDPRLMDRARLIDEVEGLRDELQTCRATIAAMEAAAAAHALQDLADAALWDYVREES